VHKNNRSQSLRALRNPEVSSDDCDQEHSTNDLVSPGKVAVIPKAASIDAYVDTDCSDDSSVQPTDGRMTVAQFCNEVFPGLSLLSQVHTKFENNVLQVYIIIQSPLAWLFLERVEFRVELSHIPARYSTDFEYIRGEGAVSGVSMVQNLNKDII
jgi:hypothetical protein